jgi:hypothetical protein
VTAVGNRNQSVGDLVPRQFFCHQNRLLVGHICVLIAMDQQGWRVIAGHVADRAKWIERFRVAVRIMTG